MPFSHFPTALSAWLSALADVLDRRSAPRLLRLLLGVLFARGRRTVTSWLRAAGIATDFRRAYSALWAAGRRSQALGYRLLGRALLPLMRQASGERLLFAIDDTPTPATAPASRAPAGTTTPRPGRPASPSSTATSGSRSPGWPTIRSGTPWPCRSALRSTSAPRTCRPWPRNIPGTSTPSWNWRPS
jgi:hypothetical protein